MLSLADMLGVVAGSQSSQGNSAVAGSSLKRSLKLAYVLTSFLSLTRVCSCVCILVIFVFKGASFYIYDIYIPFCLRAL